MRGVRGWAVGVAVALLCAAGVVLADDQRDAYYVVSYLEVAPASSGQAATLLRHYRDETRKQDGNLRAEVLQQVGRPNHFVISEAWKDQPASKAHDEASSTKQDREKLATLQVAPDDVRLLKPLDVGAVTSSGTKGAAYLVTHADAARPAPEAIAVLKPLAEASRKELGAVRFEILQQGNRLNHFTIVEIWRDQKALEAHMGAVHTKTFREGFAKISGALYDERLYNALN
jgi:quinol monooxygenase YgiN